MQRRETKPCREKKRGIEQPRRPSEEIRTNVKCKGVWLSSQYPKGNKGHTVSHGLQRDLLEGCQTRCCPKNHIRCSILSHKRGIRELVNRKSVLLSWVILGALHHDHEVGIMFLILWTYPVLLWNLMSANVWGCPWRQWWSWSRFRGSVTSRLNGTRRTICPTPG